MATSRQRERELARRRFERQAQRRAQAAKRRKKLTALTAGGLVILLALVGVIVAVSGGGGNSKSSLAAANPSTSATPSAGATAAATTAAASPTPAATPSVLACYQKAPPAPPSTQKYSAEPPLTVDTSATYTMKLDTTCGLITASLDVKDAPHTVNSFVFLSGKKFFDGDECHRVTTDSALTVLQCGDPTATGSGGPGYTFKDENLKGATYPRGTLAMANSGANTNGSQFFLVDKDSQLPPSYTPFGKITSGLDVLDKIVSHGVFGGGTDGRPAQRIFIKSMRITETGGGASASGSASPTPTASRTPSPAAKPSASASASVKASASASATK